MKLIIMGDPVTKKNHARRLRRGTRTFVVPSEAHERWAASAEHQLRKQLTGRVGPFAYPVNLACVVYRGRKRGVRGDLINYLQAVCDILAKAGAVADDKWIVQLDGCGFGELPNGEHLDPHIEIELTPLGKSAT